MRDLAVLSIRSSMFSSVITLLASASAFAADGHYTLDPAKSTLDYQFSQAGAQNKGKFTRYAVTLDVVADAPSKLDVLVEMSSLDTGDQERDETLKGTDMFWVAKFPQSQPAAGTLIGKTTIRRLDYGVGQGDWKATDQVGNDVIVLYSLRMVATAGH